MANIIITGGGNGIGYYLAEQLLEDGHKVAVMDLETDTLLDMKKHYGDRLLPCVCDLRDPVCVTQTAAYIAGIFKTIDIAVHNACRCICAPSEDTDEADYQDVFDVNYYGALRLSKAVLPYMKRQQSGRVIFTSSGVGVTGFSNISAYASSKGAIEALAKCLNLEYQGQGITFHIFHPPLTRTKSSAPFPLPQKYMADPKTVGHGFAKRIFSKHPFICHSKMQKFQVRLCYLFPFAMGGFMNSKMTALEGKDNSAKRCPQWER